MDTHVARISPQVITFSASVALVRCLFNRKLPLKLIAVWQKNTNQTKQTNKTSKQKPLGDCEQKQSWSITFFFPQTQKLHDPINCWVSPLSAQSGRRTVCSSLGPSPPTLISSVHSDVFSLNQPVDHVYSSRCHSLMNQSLPHFIFKIFQHQNSVLSP